MKNGHFSEYYEQGRDDRRKGKTLSDCPNVSRNERFDWEMGWHHEGVDMLFRKSGITLDPRYEGERRDQKASIA